MLPDMQKLGKLLPVVKDKRSWDKQIPHLQTHWHKEKVRQSKLLWIPKREGA
jgi:hypothetical protein